MLPSEMKTDSGIQGLRSKLHLTARCQRGAGNERKPVRESLENLEYKPQQEAAVIDDEISEIWLLRINVELP